MQLGKLEERAPNLGGLEIAVLQHVWDCARECDTDARGVLASLADRRITLSTVQATLERLHRKGLLARSKVGRAYRYSAAVSRSRLIGTLIRELTQRLAAGELEPVISGFVELVGDAQPELLDRLQHEAASHGRGKRG
jgi:predicted transcriptional regulator